MMTIEDVNRTIPQLSHLNSDQIRRLTNAENRCRMAETNWSKEYWYNVFKKLSEKYNARGYFRKVID